MMYRFSEGPIECHETSKCDFTLAVFVDLPDNVVVYNSCFSQELPDTAIFRPNMTGVTFRNCNLTNASVPAGNVIIDCQTDRIKVQNDLNDWLLDAAGNPVKPADHLTFAKRGLPMPLPQDIPVKKAANRVDLVAAAIAKAGI